MEDENKTIDAVKWNRFQNFLRWILIALAIFFACLIRAKFFHDSFLIGLLLAIVFGIAFAFLSSLIMKLIERTPALLRLFYVSEENETKKKGLFRR